MYDAILVFGAGVTPEGELEENSRTRVDLALQHAHEAPVLVFSGAWSMSLKTPPKRTEAAAMKAYSIAHGCDASHIKTEEHSFDTLGNAVFVKRDFVKPLGWKKLLVIVADYHIWRTKNICQLVFGPEYHITVLGAVLQLTPEERHKRTVREQASWEITRELFTVPAGDDVAIERALYELHAAYSDHPKYSKAELGAMIAERVRKIEQL